MRRVENKKLEHLPYLFSLANFQWYTVWDRPDWEGARHGGPSEVCVGCSISAIVVVGYVNSVGDVLNEARVLFNSEGSLKLSIRRDIITEDMLGS
jgi:hypothetical protein